MNKVVCIGFGGLPYPRPSAINLYVVNTEALCKGLKEDKEEPFSAKGLSLALRCFLPIMDGSAKAVISLDPVSTLFARHFMSDPARLVKSLAEVDGEHSNPGVVSWEGREIPLLCCNSLVDFQAACSAAARVPPQKPKEDLLGIPEVIDKVQYPSLAPGGSLWLRGVTDSTEGERLTVTGICCETWKRVQVLFEVSDLPLYVLSKDPTLRLPANISQRLETVSSLKSYTLYDTSHPKLLGGSEGISCHRLTMRPRTNRRQFESLLGGLRKLEGGIFCGSPDIDTSNLFQLENRFFFNQRVSLSAPSSESNDGLPPKLTGAVLLSKGVSGIVMSCETGKPLMTWASRESLDRNQLIAHLASVDLVFFLAPPEVHLELAYLKTSSCLPAALINLKDHDLALEGANLIKEASRLRGEVLRQDLSDFYRILYEEIGIASFGDQALSVNRRNTLLYHRELCRDTPDFVPVVVVANQRLFGAEDKRKGHDGALLVNPAEKQKVSVLSRGVSEFDIKSSYPSRIIAHNISPEGRGVLPRLMKRLISLRGKSPAYKLLANTCYGWLSLLFPHLGGQVTLAGRELLQRSIDLCNETLGAGRVCFGSNDAIFVRCSKEEEATLERVLSENTDASWSIKHRFSTFLKSAKQELIYCGLLEDGTLLTSAMYFENVGAPQTFKHHIRERIELALKEPGRGINLFRPPPMEGPLINSLPTQQASFYRAAAMLCLNDNPNKSQIAPVVILSHENAPVSDRRVAVYTGRNSKNLRPCTDRVTWSDVSEDWYNAQWATATGQIKDIFSSIVNQ